MGKRGQPQKDECVNGHDLTKQENVGIVRRKKKMKSGVKVYTERQCVPCRNKRNREWYDNNRKKVA